MPAKGSTKSTAPKAEAEAPAEEEVDTSNLQPAVATLEEALAASARPPEPEAEPVERSGDGMADESEFEPLDNDDVPPTEVSSTDEVPVNE